MRSEMQLNIEAILQHIKDKFRNNKTAFAEEIGVSREYLNLVLNKKANSHSSKICNGVIMYCERNNLDHRKYIFLS